MALTTTPISLKPNKTNNFPNHHAKPTTPRFTKTTITLHFQSHKPLTKRRTTTSLIFSVLAIPMSTKSAAKAEGNPFDFLRMTVPDQTVEEAEAGIKPHALSLIQVKELLEEGMDSWKEAQKELRRSSALVRQDLYTIIQGKPGAERPLLRDLYFKLFSNVTGLDYAARDRNATRVWECYHNIVLTLDEIFSKI